MDPHFTFENKHFSLVNLLGKGLLACWVLLNILSITSCETLGDPITDNSSVQILAPNGGEEFCPNSPIEITWKANDLESVSIEYTTNDGSSWTEVQLSVSAANEYYMWEPGELAPGNYRLRLRSLSSDIIRSTSDPFIVNTGVVEMDAVNALKVTTYSDMAIRWDNACKARVRLDISIDQGKNWETLAEELTTENFLWQNIPERMTTDSAYLRIVNLDEEGSFDITPEPFSINWEREFPLAEINSGEVIQSDIWGPYTIIKYLDEENNEIYEGLLLSCEENCLAYWNPEVEQYQCTCNGGESYYNALGCGIETSAGTRLDALRTYINGDKLVVRGLLADGDRCQ